MTRFDIGHLMSTAAQLRKTVFTDADGDEVDRTQHLSASEFMGCIRRLAYEKRKTDPDPDHYQNWGFFERGHNVEDWTVKILDDVAGRQGWKLLYTGEEQRSLISADRKISATPDGMILTGTEDVVVEIKSIDPRAHLEKAKKDHVYQCQLQIELFNEVTDHNPDRGIIIYVDASNYENIRWFDVERNPDVMIVARKRYDEIMSTEPEELTPEGRYLDVCKWCPFYKRCADTQMENFPAPVQAENPVDDSVVTNVGLLVSDYDKGKSMEKEGKKIKEAAAEDIKQALRNEGVPIIDCADYKVALSQTEGRVKYDFDQMREDGIDVDEYETRGDPGERLNVTVRRQS